MRIDTWLKSREEPGTLAHTAREILAKDKSYAAAEKTLRSLYILEAVLKQGGNQVQAANSIGLSRRTVHNTVRAMGFTALEMRRIVGQLKGKFDGAA